MYIMSAELPLSTNTLLVLKPSISSIMMSGSSWGCLIPLESRSKNMMSSLSDCWYCWSSYNKSSSKQPSWYRSPCYRSDFSYGLLWMISSIILEIIIGFVISPCSRVVVSFDELLEFSLLNQFFYLFFKIMTFISVMAMILMKMTVLLLVTLPRGHA